MTAAGFGGEAQARWEIGACPLFRHGVLIDDVMAISRLKLEAEDRALILGADAGGAEAQCDLALLLLTQNLPADAAYWLGLAARQHHSEAMYQLGRCTLAGVGVEANLAAGVEWISRAAALGHGTAWQIVQYLMGPDRPALEGAALDAKLEAIEQKVVLAALRETAEPG